MNYPFDILYAERNGNESFCKDWEPGLSGKYPVHNCTCCAGKVIVSVRDNLDGSFIIKIANISTECVTGWWGVRRTWKWDENGFTLVPGVFYNGNKQEKIRELPVIDMPDSPVYQLPLSAAAMPAVFAAVTTEGENGFYWRISPMSSAGWNGIEFNAAAGNMTVWMPVREERVYRYGAPENYGREPHVLQPQQSMSLILQINKIDAVTPEDIFDLCWQARADFSDDEPIQESKISLDEAAELVGNWLMKKHFVRGFNNEPMLLNAFMDINRENIPVDEIAEWNIIIGWCSGTMTALPLLKHNDEARKAVTEYIDFLCSDGFFVSGLKKPVFDGRKWIDLAECPKYADYEHVRMYGDFVYWLGKCIRREKEQGREHLQWQEVFRKQTDIFVDIWQRCHDFGIYWTTDEAKIVPRRRGTAAGAFPFLALSEALSHFPEDKNLLTILPEIAELYAERVLKSGRSNGGPLDIMEADDSESISALTNAYCNLYEQTGNRNFLNYALAAAKILASWVMAYRPPFPPASSLEKLNLKGGVIANVQNRHIGPGICTNSGVFLRKLAQWTGDERWEILYRQIGRAAVECVCVDEKEFPGIYGGKMEPFAAGMVSEQMNVSDALNNPGECWRVSASWPATAVMLYWFENQL